MSFLPDDYQAPSASSYYLKLTEGENRVRILSKPIFGWEDWKDNKPVRFVMDKKPAKSFDPKKPVKHFWAFVVFNCHAEQIQIMQITQATIRKNIEALCRDKDWGSPYGYDIKIIKTGDGVDTEYAVNPVPHKPIDPYLITSFNEKRCNLNALFTNADPFSHEWSEEELTPLADTETKDVFKEVSKKIVKLKDEKDEKISSEEASNLSVLLGQLSHGFNEQVNDFMQKQGIENISDLSYHTYERLLKKALIEQAKAVTETK